MPRSRFFTNPFSDHETHSEGQYAAINWLDQIKGVIKSIVDAFPNISNSDGGLYVGDAGIAYMLLHSSNFQPLAEHRSSYISLAKHIYKKDLEFSRKSRPEDAVSFILGPAGVYVLGALLGNAMNNSSLVQENVQRYKSLAKVCIQPRFLTCGSDELFVGRAGYLCGALALQKKLGIKVLDDETINAICTIIVKSGQEYAKHHRSKSPLMYAYYDTEYLGAAHGLSSILQMMLSCPSFLEQCPEAVREVRQATDWLLSTQQANGNFAPATDEIQSSSRPEAEQLIHWCHGAPGVIYLFARAYQVWGDEKYLQACLRCGELTWQAGLLKKGPGICHGVAGSGYVFLLLYRLTGDKKHLHRAQQFASFLFSQTFQAGARTPDSPYSLYEGWAGTVCFLIDLQQPDRAEFPFFDVF